MIFISHKQAETRIASALVELLLAGIQINRSLVVCTSVPGHQLPFGQNIPDLLKGNIGSSNAIFAILTQESLKSPWVLFELGASWALGKIVIPILAPGLKAESLPGPLASYPCISIDKPDATARLSDSINQVARALGKKSQLGGAFQQKLIDFISTFGSLKAEILQARAFLLSFLLNDFFFGDSERPEDLIGQIKIHARELGVDLQPNWESQRNLELEDRGQAINRLMNLLGGQIKAKNSTLIPYFEAGINITIDAVRGERKHFAETLRKLTIPESRWASEPNLLAQLNSIAGYFQEIVRQ